MRYLPPQVDVTTDFHHDANGRDPDTFSPALRDYHYALWSKRLPNGDHFNLEKVNRGRSVYLRYTTGHEVFVLSSDLILTSSRGPCRTFYEETPESARSEFHSQGQTIGGRIVFPCLRVNGKHTINQARGTHPRIRDRFDLTLECIRRHYIGDPSPLGKVLQRYASFFDLFVNFEEYIRFFLLDDLVEERRVQFFLLFDDFQGSALPDSQEDYERYLDAQLAFLHARNSRIQRWTTTV